MIKRLALGLVALLLILPAVPAGAQGISQKVAVCNPAFTARCVAPDANGATPVTIAGPSAAVPSTNASTTVTAGGTYQTVFLGSTSRKGCSIQNPTTASEILSVRVKSTAVFTLTAGSVFQCGSPGDIVISDLIEVTATTTGHAFTAVSQ